MIKAERIGSRPTLGGRFKLTRKPLYPSTPERLLRGVKRRNAPSRWEGRARSGLVARTMMGQIAVAYVKEKAKIRLGLEL